MDHNRIKIDRLINSAQEEIKQGSYQSAISFYKEAKKIALKANEKEIANELSAIISEIHRYDLQEVAYNCLR